MVKEGSKGFQVEIPAEAVTEALKSVEKYMPSEGKAGEAPEETLLEVEVSPQGEAPGPQPGPEPSEELARLRAELAETKDRMLRVAADADNIRKRALRERQEAIKFGLEGILKDLLPLVDNLDRTLEHVPADSADPALVALRQGVAMVRHQLLDTLGGHHATTFETLGQPFDPARHEALSQEASAEAKPGTVLRELHRGFVLHDRLLRPALVVVARAPEDTHAAPPAGQAPEDT
jgi:molecular chaperone GrpE